MDEGLGGRSVLVFGASGALGSGVAAAFAAAGADVTGTDIAVPDGGAAVDSVSYAAADVTDDDALRALFDRRPRPGRSSTPSAGSHRGGRWPNSTRRNCAQLELNLVPPR